jgi:hypothetical protein
MKKQMIDMKQSTKNKLSMWNDSATQQTAQWMYAMRTERMWVFLVDAKLIKHIWLSQEVGETVSKTGGPKAQPCSPMLGANKVNTKNYTPALSK